MEDKKYAVFLRNNKDGSIEGAIDGELGTFCPIKSGKPIPPGADLVHFKSTPASPLIWESEVVYKSERSGPSRTTNAKWRVGWDRIFSNN